jgi:glycosyltransferase involved in cell wall biosynthesis
MAAVADPEISVVVPTRDRARRLQRLLTSLREQTLDRAAFEVIVVDDGSGDETPRLLESEGERGGLAIRVIRRERPGGPAAARNEGWRSARGPVVAFTDDDCVADAAWLEAGLAAAKRDPGAIVQGRTDPDPEEWKSFGPFSHTLRIPEPTPWFETCNVFYPREVLERLDGFDEHVFSAPAGEDADLAWRAIEQGTPHAFAGEALVYHAVLQVGALGKLRLAALRSDAIASMARHPELRRRHLWRGVFWDPHHALFFRALLGLVLPRRLALVRLWLAAPYLQYLTARRTGPLLAPYLVVRDLVEVGAVLRAAAKARILVL